MVCWLLKFRHEIDGWKMMCVCAFALKWNDSDDFVYGFGWC